MKLLYEFKGIKNREELNKCFFDECSEFRYETDYEFRQAVAEGFISFDNDCTQIWVDAVED